MTGGDNLQLAAHLFDTSRSHEGIALISPACLHTNAAVANAERVFIMKLSARVEDLSSITTEEDFWSATILFGYRDSGDLVNESEMVAS